MYTYVYTYDMYTPMYTPMYMYTCTPYMTVRMVTLTAQNTVYIHCIY